MTKNYELIFFSNFETIFRLFFGDCLGFLMLLQHNFDDLTCFQVLAQPKITLWVDLILIWNNIRPLSTINNGLTIMLFPISDNFQVFLAIACFLVLLQSKSLPRWIWIERFIFTIGPLLTKNHGLNIMLFPCFGVFEHYMCYLMVLKPIFADFTRILVLLQPSLWRFYAFSGTITAPSLSNCMLVSTRL